MSGSISIQCEQASPVLLLAKRQNELQVIYSPNSDTMCNHDGDGLHIVVHGSCDLMLKNLSLSELCDSNLQTPTEYCRQVTESVQLTLGQY